MKNHKQNPHFVHIGRHLLDWYAQNARDLPFRNTKDPYKIWICEIVFQQTRIAQGLQHYINFIERFPDVHTLASAQVEEVLLYWKGLGYYSRAINIHKASQQIINDFEGVFPTDYNQILSLKGIGKYTAAAISSICFGMQIPAVDGNFYRVLSRVFADDFDVSSSQAFTYFSALAQSTMPPHSAGDYNQAMMDIGSEICKPKNQLCTQCPLKDFCLAFQGNRIADYPVKLKKVKVSDLELTYFFIHFNGHFLIKQRSDDFIWKKLYEFPTIVDKGMVYNEWNSTIIKHKLTHKNLVVTIYKIEVETETEFKNFAEKYNFEIINKETAALKSFPKPLENYLGGL